MKTTSTRLSLQSAEIQYSQSVLEHLRQYFSMVETMASESDLVQIMNQNFLCQNI